MARDLKVWNLTSTRPNGVDVRHADGRPCVQAALVCAAFTKKRAAEIFGVSVRTLNTWGSEGGSDRWVDRAFTHPDKLLVFGLDTGNTVNGVRDGVAIIEKESS
jgi:hypothetical protein